MTTTIKIFPMTAVGIPFGVRLKAQANWNQLEGDWQRLLALDPGGVFIAEFDGAPAGTLATTLLGSVAWISMVLVDQSLRGKGIGTALLEHALKYLDGRGVPGVRLDATPMGRPLYEKLGFVGEYEVSRYEGVLPEGPAVPPVIPFRSELREGIIALDRRVTATDRAKLLYSLFRECPDTVRVVMDGASVSGYLCSRPGSRAVQVGPCIAGEAAGSALLADACHRFGGQRAFIDVPVPNAAAIALVESLGLTVQRPFLRMIRGAAIVDRPEEIWTSFGPEKG